MEPVYAMWLKDLTGMTPRKCHAFFNVFNTFEEIYMASAKELNDIWEKSGDRKKTLFIKQADLDKHRLNIDLYNRRFSDLKKDYHVITSRDTYYPEKLKEIDDHPFVLFGRSQKLTRHKKRGGDFFPTISIGVVGARRCTLYGKDIARQFAQDLAKEGVNIVSGLAYGIDIASHEGALMAKRSGSPMWKAESECTNECSGFTTAVLGGGVSNCYPTKHEKVFNQIIEEGMVLSEEWFDTPVEPFMFPKRNRIISGMSHGILVVEAANKSGSLITADFALEQGRDVFAVPGRLLDPKAMGSNKLIKQGAKCVFSYDDILEEYVHLFKEKRDKSEKKEKKLEEIEKIVYSCISYEPTHEEVLINKVLEEKENCLGDGDYAKIFTKEELTLWTTLTSADVKLTMLTLELKGIISKISGCYYARSEV